MLKINKIMAISVPNTENIANPASIPVKPSNITIKALALKRFVEFRV